MLESPHYWRNAQAECTHSGGSIDVSSRLDRDGTRSNQAKSACVAASSSIDVSSRTQVDQVQGTTTGSGSATGSGALLASVAHDDIVKVSMADPVRAQTLG